MAVGSLTMNSGYGGLHQETRPWAFRAIPRTWDSPPSRPPPPIPARADAPMSKLHRLPGPLRHPSTPMEELLSCGGGLWKLLGSVLVRDLEARDPSVSPNLSAARLVFLEVWLALAFRGCEDLVPGGRWEGALPRFR